MGVIVASFFFLFDFSPSLSQVSSQTIKQTNQPTKRTDASLSMSILLLCTIVERMHPHRRWHTADQITPPQNTKTRSDGS